MGSTGQAKRGFASELAIVLAIYIGLFFVEYPPVFLVGYWSWSGLVHKTITGVLLALNLVITQYVAKRLGLFGMGRKAEPRVPVP